VSFGRSMICARAALALASSSLPLAPPAWVRISTASGAGLARYLPSSALTSLVAFCADLITTTLPPPNSDGEVSESSSRGARSAPSRSWTSPPWPPDSSAAAVRAAAVRAAAISSRTARSTRNSSSPTTSVTGATVVAGGFTGGRGGRAGMVAACHGDGAGAESGWGRECEPGDRTAVRAR
jgi:hypothetical protein